MEFISIFVPTLLKNVNTLKWRYVCHLKHITLFQMCTQLTSLSVVLFSEVNESLSLHYPLHLKTIEANSLPPLEHWNYLTLLLQKLNVIAVGGGGGVHLNVFRTNKLSFSKFNFMFQSHDSHNSVSTHKSTFSPLFYCSLYTPDVYEYKCPQ